MIQRIFVAIGALAASATLLFLGACDGHSWEKTQKQHLPHGGHAEHGEADTGHAAPAETPAEALGDAEKKAD